jgi:hypothetical protein
MVSLDLACRIPHLLADQTLPRICIAFLLNNGVQYHAAHIIGLLEYFITAFLIDENAATSSDLILFRRWWMGYGSLMIGEFPYFILLSLATHSGFASLESLAPCLRWTSFTVPRHDPCCGLILARC